MQISLKIVAVLITIITGHIIDKPQPSENSRRIARIANGKPVGQYDYPYVVGLRTKNSDGEMNFCTGTLVSPLFVLTAAHCIVETTTKEVCRNDPRNLTNEKRSVVKHFIHSLFNQITLVADLCLLKINKPFENITIFAVISRYSNPFANENKLKCIVLGWGKNKNDYPTDRANVATVWVNYGPNACKVPPDNDFIKNIVKRTWKEFLCPVPNNRMTCIGDSGGALVCRGLLFGITSHGYNYYPETSHLPTECGNIRVQTRHVFVSNYQKWIDDIIYFGTSTTIKCNRLLFGIQFCIIYLSILSTQ